MVRSVAWESYGLRATMIRLRRTAWEASGWTEFIELHPIIEPTTKRLFLTFPGKRVNYREGDVESEENNESGSSGTSESDYQDNDDEPSEPDEATRGDDAFEEEEQNGNRFSGNEWSAKEANLKVVFGVEYRAPDWTASFGLERFMKVSIVCIWVKFLLFDRLVAWDYPSDRLL